MGARPPKGLRLSKKIGSLCRKHTGLCPGDEVRFEIVVSNEGPTQTVTLCDSVSDVLADVTYESDTGITGEGNQIEEAFEIESGATVTFEVIGTVAEGVCEPKAFTNVATLKPEDECVDPITDAAPTCVVGDANDLIVCPPYDLDHAGLMAQLLGFDDASKAKLFDAVNCGTTLADICEAALNPTVENILTEEVLQQICDSVLEKFASAELKQAITDCITGEDSPLTKELIGSIFQGE